MDVGEGVGALGVMRCGSDRDRVLCACIILGRKLIIRMVCQTKQKLHGCNMDISHSVRIFHLRPSASIVFYWLGGTGRLMWLHCACVNGGGFDGR